MLRGTFPSAVTTIVVLVCITGCPPGNPVAGPPSITWGVLDQTTGQLHDGDGGTDNVAVSVNDNYIITFRPTSSGGLRSVSLDGTMFTSCFAQAPDGSRFLLARRNINAPQVPQNVTVSPPSTQNPLVIAPFTWSKLDCHTKVNFAGPPPVAVEAFASGPGTFTLTGAATGTNGQTATGTLTLTAP